MTWWQWILIALGCVAALPLAGVVLYLVAMGLVLALCVAALPIVFVFCLVASGWEAMRR